MKLFLSALVLTSSLLVGCSSNSNEYKNKWVYIGVTPEGGKAYVSRMMKNTVIYRAVLNGNVYTTEFMFNCDNSQVKEIIDVNDISKGFSKEWELILPNTLGDEMLKVVCN